MKKAGTKPRKGARDDEDGTEGGDVEDWTQARALVKPDDQLELSEVELKEEITRILTANNPHAAQNKCIYSFKEKIFKSVGPVDHLAIHFQLEGNLLHTDSDEAKRQQQRSMGGGADIGEGEDEKHETVPETTEGGGEPEKEVESPAREQTEMEEGKDRDDDGATPAPKTEGGGKLTNQFNYSERASQTYNNQLKDRNTMTEPPPRLNFSASVTQWEIYDSYQEDFERLQREKDKESKKGAPKKDEGATKKKFHVAESQGDDLAKVSNASKIIERMINQNTFNEIAMDFKYWEDVSDEFKDQEGTLLPLWKFSFEGAKKLAVTCMAWNTKYPDLFAVGHGSYNFSQVASQFGQKTHGMILFYTLKNPSFPEYRYTTEIGVMSLDIHPDYPYLAAIGFYDGSVGVFNVTDEVTTPAYLSTAKNGKHTDPVWQVKWQKNDLDNNLNFFSVSSDGRVVIWTLIKNELTYYDVIKLAIVDKPQQDGPEGAKLLTLGAGTTFDFHPQQDYLFLVGTEEGMICKCSKAYGSHFLDKYQAHHMAVYKVSWNPFHPKVFITCSADWTVKIWDHTYPEPLFIYDLNAPVGDVAWSPYSSTVFAAVTNDGKVFVFDLNINKFEPLCQQAIVQKKKSKLTHVAFNPCYPVLMVSDDRGHITSLKLSPNLRKMPKEKKNEVAKKPEEVEFAKMEKILSTVRDSDKKE